MLGSLFRPVFLLPCYHCIALQLNGRSPEQLVDPPLGFSLQVEKKEQSSVWQAVTLDKVSGQEKNALTLLSRL